MKLFLIAAVALVPTTAFAEGVASPVVAQAPAAYDIVRVNAQWRATYVSAAQSFDRWLEQDSEAAAVMTFATGHPGRTKMLIEWALQNPMGDLNGFNDSHGGLANELAKNPNGTANLISWARQNAGAARTLTASSQGFRIAVVPH